MTSSSNEGGTAVFALRLMDFLALLEVFVVRRFEIKQKMWSLGGKFTIKDESGLSVYEVKGSFLQIPKTFTLSDMSGNLISQIEKKILTFLPQFTVNLSNGQTFVLKKELT